MALEPSRSSQTSSEQGVGGWSPPREGFALRFPRDAVGAIDQVCKFLWSQRLNPAVDTNDESAFLKIVSQVLKRLIETDPEGPAVEVRWRSRDLEIVNRGAPLFLSEEGSFSTGVENKGRLLLESRGRKGQLIRILRKENSDLPWPEDEGDSAIETTYSGSLSTQVRFSPIGPGSELELTELFYRVYGYSYINDTVYEPRKIREMWESGKLKSFAAVRSDGRMIGHVGILRWNESPLVLEACWGVVDPKAKSRGVFKELLALTMAEVKKQDPQYCFFDFVTNHHVSQRELAHYGVHDLALFVGCQSRSTQASLEKLGIGQDSREMVRYTLLYSIWTSKLQPFGDLTSLPPQLGEMFEPFLRRLGLEWAPTSRFDFLGEEGTFNEVLQPEQGAVVFQIEKSGVRALERLLERWSYLLREGYQYCGVDFPLREPGLGQAYDILASNGFCVGGLLPDRYSDRLAFRLQAIGPTKVAFDDIRLYSETAKALLKIIRADHERNLII